MTKLTAPQRALLLASGPDDLPLSKEGAGVDIRGGQFAAAKALEEKGLGHREGPGGFRYAGMYWNNAAGLALRAHLLRKEAK